MKSKITIHNHVLKDWLSLNAHIMKLSDERALSQLIDEELNGRRRKAFVMRIFHRVNRLRTQRETAALQAKLKSAR
jgi:hypothetical protein